MKTSSSSLHIKIKKKLPFYQKLKEEISIIENLVFKKNEQRILKKLFIFIGSEKGFCADYNTTVSKKFHKIFNDQKDNKNIYILIGKALIKKINKVDDSIFTFLEFREKSFSLLKERIAFIIEKNNIDSIEIFFHESKFIGNKEFTSFQFSVDSSSFKIKNDFYTGHFKEDEIKENFFSLNYFFILSHFFYMSLLAEQGTRFIAMDAALRNTKEAIETNKKLYFKTRKENINKQLQDITASLL